MANKLEEARKIINEVDSEMAKLFVKRMRAAEMVYEYKKEFGLPILDSKRENEVIKKNTALIEDRVLKEYYDIYIRDLMSISRAYQYRMQEEGQGSSSKKIHVNLKENSYDILVERGCIKYAGKHLNLERRVLIVTDSGVPELYTQTVARQCKDSVIYIVEAGENSKSLEVFRKLLQLMLEKDFSRKDCVVGDLAGFAASAYMRGIDFYNIPTTLLSQIDSSIGGKTAINLSGMKNIVGAFYQPKMVLIDPELLKSLSERQISNGLAEAVKMALTSDKELFDIFENKDIESHLDEIIIRSLNIKKDVVEQDEKEAGIRKILNFGHTIGHGIESSCNMTELYHGECVALGMLPMCADSIQYRVVEVLKKCGLYNSIEYDWEKIKEAAFHDKKVDGDSVTITLVPEIGRYQLKTIKSTEVIEMAKKLWKGDNIVLTGMPGCGKSTVGKLLESEEFELIDTDIEIEKRCGCTIKELINVKGEKYFRDLETEVIKEVSAMKSKIIATGGGTVLRKENVEYLKRKGKIFFIKADINRLEVTDDRPLSDTFDKLKRMYSERKDIYVSTADIVVPDMKTAEEEAEYIKRKRMELIL